MHRNAVWLISTTVAILVSSDIAIPASVRSEWKALPPKVLKCFRMAAKRENTSLEQLVLSGVRPSDPRISTVLQTCQQYARPMRSSFQCVLNDGSGGSIETLCREYYVKQVGGQMTEISADEALDIALGGQSVQIMYTETSEGHQRRAEKVIKTLESQTDEGDDDSGEPSQVDGSSHSNTEMGQQQPTSIGESVDNGNSLQDGSASERKYQAELLEKERIRRSAAAKWQQEWAEKNGINSHGGTTPSPDEKGAADENDAETDSSAGQRHLATNDKSEQKAPQSQTSAEQVDQTTSDDKIIDEAKELYQSSNYYEAYRKIYKLAESGNPEAQFVLGAVSDRIDELKARGEPLKWYRLAAKQGNLRAQENLASALLDGDLGVKDPQEAIYWLKLAAGQGDTSSYYQLSYIYSTGEFIPVDSNEARAWLAKCLGANDSWSKKCVELQQRLDSGPVYTIIFTCTDSTFSGRDREFANLLFQTMKSNDLIAYNQLYRNPLINEVCRFQETPTTKDYVDASVSDYKYGKNAILVFKASNSVEGIIVK